MNELEYTDVEYAGLYIDEEYAGLEQNEKYAGLCTDEECCDHAFIASCLVSMMEHEVEMIMTNAEPATLWKTENSDIRLLTNTVVSLGFASSRDLVEGIVKGSALKFNTLSGLQFRGVRSGNRPLPKKGLKKEGKENPLKKSPQGDFSSEVLKFDISGIRNYGFTVIAERNSFRLFAFLRKRLYLCRNKNRWTVMKKFIALAALLALVSLSAAAQPRLFVGQNEPLGVGRGIHPGRVAWIHSPGVAKWDGETGLWVEDRWNDQAKADAMVRDAVMAVTGEKSARKAWTALFKSFNAAHGRGKRGYRHGERIAIKLNMNNVVTHHDTIDLNSSPFVTLALLRSLVNDGGVRQQDITVTDPSRCITDSIFNKCHREFPDVTFADNIGGDGRVKCEYYPEQIKYSADNGKLARGLAKCIVDADYLINSALLKTHKGPGVTLTAKNWYGCTDINIDWHKNGHAGFSADKRHGRPGYKTFVDFIGHKDLGQKCILFLIDGTYGSRDVNGKPFPKWQKAPFSNDWCCSLIASQDPLACDAVGMDLLISEWPEFGSFNYCDEYLREAATIPSPVSGTTYDPEQDGTPLTAPLGIMEHCDKERRYVKIEVRSEK